MQLEIDNDGDLVVVRRPAPDSPLPDARRQQPSNEEELVLSEVHMESLRPSPGCSAATTFTDSAGQPAVSVQHSMATPLRSVGLQVWRGALLLADLILHRGAAAFEGDTALELGAGSGLAGLILSRFARAVYLTDTGVEVLANCQANAERHLQLCSSPNGSAGAAGVAEAAPLVLVRQLDWLEPPDWLLERTPDAGPQKSGSCSGSGQQPSAQQQQQQQQQQQGEAFAWRPEDAAALQRLDYLLAADSVYDDVLTEAFMRSAVLLMRHARRHSGRSPRLLVGLERRVCFTMTDQAVRAPAYDYWRTLFEAADCPVEGTAATAAGTAAGAAETAGAASSAPPEEGSAAAGWQRASRQQAPFPLVGRQIELESVPQALHPFERNEYLELWELELRG